VNGQWQVVARHDFMPFGEEVAPPPPPSDKRLFTGKERDSETGMDYFGARYLRASAGRFTSVDPALTIKENLADPQRWNRYLYARGNPLNRLDPDGRDAYKIFLPLGSLGGNWAAAEAAAEKAGHTFQVFSGKEATVSAYNAALGDPANRVFWVGHTSGDKTGKHAIILEGGRSAGSVADIKGTPVRVAVNANTVGLFGCNSVALASQYTSGTFVGVASGANQQSDVRTMDRGAAEFVASDASGNSPAQSARAASKAWSSQCTGSTWMILRPRSRSWSRPRNRRRSVKITRLLVFALVCVVSVSLSGQGAGTESCRHDEIRHSGGWAIPGVKNPSARASVKPGEPILRVDKLVPHPREVWIDRIECNVSDGRLEISREKVVVTQLWRRSVRGRPFAYLMSLNPLDPKTGRPLGFEYAHYYYDPDGSGELSIFVDVGKIPEEYFIPEWARRLADGRH